MGLAERVVAPFRRYARSVGPPAEAAFDCNSLAVRAINSARGWQMRLDWSKGHVSRWQTTQVVRRFEAAAPSALRVLACHHPLVEAV